MHWRLSLARPRLLKVYCYWWRRYLGIGELLRSFSTQQFRLTEFKMEIYVLVFASFRKGDVMFFNDLKNTYLQITIHPESRPYIWLALKGKVFQFKVLCFSLSNLIFTRVFRLVSAWAHQQVIHLRCSLDD